VAAFQKKKKKKKKIEYNKIVTTDSFSSETYFVVIVLSSHIFFLKHSLITQREINITFSIIVFFFNWNPAHSSNRINDFFLSFSLYFSLSNLLQLQT